MAINSSFTVVQRACYCVRTRRRETTRLVGQRAAPCTTRAAAFHCRRVGAAPLLNGSSSSWCARASVPLLTVAWRRQSGTDEPHGDETECLSHTRALSLLRLLQMEGSKVAAGSGRRCSASLTLATAPTWPRASVRENYLLRLPNGFASLTPCLCPPERDYRSLCTKQPIGKKLFQQFCRSRPDLRNCTALLDALVRF